MQGGARTGGQTEQDLEMKAMADGDTTRAKERWAKQSPFSNKNIAAGPVFGFPAPPPLKLMGVPIPEWVAE